MDNTQRAYIALGTNLPFEGVGGPALLAQAVLTLQASGLKIRALSSVWETAAWPPDSGQPDYYNAAAELDREGLEPQPLYATLRAIETRFGRERRGRYGYRTMDLDILALDGCVGTFGDIVLPHPHMHERAFVLAPLAEIAPDWRHPAAGRTVQELLAGLPAGSEYRRLGPLAMPGRG
ncbi:MAG: 2-amino-4-hydroxy-6-hydroxymethyldihydropteridine diphosphokinase [Hyphomonadaceae bacterium]